MDGPTNVVKCACNQKTCTTELSIDTTPESSFLSITRDGRDYASVGMYLGIEELNTLIVLCKKAVKELKRGQYASD